MLHIQICRTDIVTVILCGVKFGELQQVRDRYWGFVAVGGGGNVCVSGGRNRGVQRVVW
jgi:hypothetical protein